MELVQVVYGRDISFVIPSCRFHRFVVVVVVEIFVNYFDPYAIVESTGKSYS